MFMAQAFLQGDRRGNYLMDHLVMIRLMVKVRLHYPLEEYAYI